MSNDAVPERDAILDRMTEAFFALNSDREFTYLNPEAQEIICNAIGETRSIDTLKGQHIWEEIPDAVDTKFYEQYEHAFETQEPVAFEAEYEPLDAWYEVRAYPSESGLTVFFQDITDRKRHERRLERQARQFAGFGKILAHDLKNPLTVAVGRVEAAHDMNDISHLETATLALNRLEELIDDLANVLAEGALVRDIEPVAIAEAVNDAWGACETADATLVIDEPVTIAADWDALVRLFENLIGNTIEHAGQGATVRVGALPAGFYFEDDGSGIPPEERETVFEPGYTTKSSGSGLGLASVHQLVMAHGWNVTVTSSAAGGARFEFTDVEISE